MDSPSPGVVDDSSFPPDGVVEAIGTRVTLEDFDPHSSESSESIVPGQRKMAESPGRVARTPGHCDAIILTFDLCEYGKAWPWRSRFGKH